ncbi:tRNA (N6-isopentenyl adenosine(37)-C2)-methylthiotransferase MiaB [Chloroflexota bacterium]
MTKGKRLINNLKYHLWTIGCQMNKADSERVGAYLEQSGYLAAGIEDADLIVLNSCVVRQSAENRVLGKLNTLKTLKKARPDLAIALTGCLVNSRIGELEDLFPQVDLFFKPQAFSELVEWLEGQGMPSQGPEPGSPLPSHPSPSTFIPIIQGCDNFCSYCIVPYRRGREKSRPVSEIVCEVEELVQRGMREVTLLGQNVDSYGHDLPAEPGLADLLAELNSLDGLVRIRFLTSHPKDMSPGLIQAVARFDKVCEHISLPVQSGDDSTLTAMRRGYTVARYRQLVGQIRGEIPEVALSTDVIVGFPGEAEPQFQQTVNLLRELRFDTVHVAAYSPRPDTMASKKLEDDVPLPEKRRRLEEVEGLQEGIAREVNAQLLGRAVEVLVEDQKKGRWQGRTRTNKLVFFDDIADHLGQLVKVKIERTSPWALQGKLVERLS